LIRKSDLITKQIQSIHYKNIYYDIIHNNSSKINQLEIFKENYFKEIIAKNIAYYVAIAESQKDFSKIALGIQYDLNTQNKDYQ